MAANQSSHSRPVAQQLPGKGFYEISGLAWSGGGAIRLVESRPTAGRSGIRPSSRALPQRMAFTRFGYQWNWDGNETEILLRCTDELGSGATDARPARQGTGTNLYDQDFQRARVWTTAFKPWHIASDGRVTNGFA